MFNILKKILIPLTWIYATLLWLHRIWQKRLAPVKLSVPVISVGNITVGGTGKTELVALLAKFFLSQGLKPGILSRGYGRRNIKELVVVSDGSEVEAKIENAGDEPYLLASRLAGVGVVVSQDRVKAGNYAIKNLGCQILILDDGFQRRYQIKRDLDLVLIDAADPWGGKHLLPVGSLREPLNTLTEADLIILSRSEQYAVNDTLRELSKITNKTVFKAEHKPTRIIEVNQGRVYHVDSLARQRVIAVAGIARPQSFVKTLQALKAEVVATLFYPDHHWYTLAEVKKIISLSKSLSAKIITTTKDMLKLKTYKIEDELLALEIEFTLSDLKEFELCLRKSIQ